MGDPVYFDNTGAISFTAQNTQIGTVIDASATGAIFIDTITTAEIDYDPTVLTAVTGVGNFTATDVQIIGETLYVLTTNDFQIYDIQNPAAPFLISTTAQGGNAFQVAGKYMFIVNAVDAVNNMNSLVIYDIVNPNIPVLTGVPSVFIGPQDIYVSGAWAYIADGSSSNLLIVDISNPVVPIIRSQFTHSGIVGPYNAYGVFVRGKYAYIAADTQGLIIADVSNKNLPTFVSQVASGVSDNAKKVYVEGTKAYVADGINGMRIVDVANPFFPGYTVPTNLVPGISVEDVYVAGKYAFMADSVGNGLQVVDVSVPGSPAVISSFTAVVNNLNAVKVAGRYAWIAEAGGPAGIGLRAISLGGAQIASAEIASLQAGELNVIGNITSQGDLYVRDGAVFGGDVFVDDANMAVEGSMVISDSGSSISASDPSAILGLYSTAKGFLLPRMTTVQRDAIASPATGLQIFNTTTNSVEFYNGTSWVSSGTGAKVVQTTTTTYDGNFTHAGTSTVGYQAANNICNDFLSGSHLCQTSEIITIIANEDISATGLDFDNLANAWVIEGPPGYTANANDCLGYTTNSNTALGAWWDFNANGGGMGWLVNCEEKRAIDCCK